jgi:myosin heavy subunit
MAKPLGILSLLDDESRLPKVKDDVFNYKSLKFLFNRQVIKRLSKN